MSADRDATLFFKWGLRMTRGTLTFHESHKSKNRKFARVSPDTRVSSPTQIALRSRV
jgi:hypothetical protein